MVKTKNNVQKISTPGSALRGHRHGQDSHLEYIASYNAKPVSRARSKSTLGSSGSPGMMMPSAPSIYRNLSMDSQASETENAVNNMDIKMAEVEASIDYNKIFIKPATEGIAWDKFPTQNLTEDEIKLRKEEQEAEKKLLEKEISNFISTEIEWVPINKINLNEEDKEKMNKFLEILEEDDDVQNVFTNAI